MTEGSSGPETPTASEGDIAESAQWQRRGDLYFPSASTQSRLTAGIYTAQHSDSLGWGLGMMKPKMEGLCLLPESKMRSVLEDVRIFWSLSDEYAKYGLPHKRGILLFGPPGTGKSGIIQLIAEEIVQRNGVVMVMNQRPDVHIDLFTAFRKVEPRRPLLLVMEDIDDIIKRHGESDILNLLDGLRDVQDVVFLATTNYPHLLAERVLNRPGRFDRRLFIGPLTTLAREAYLEHLSEKNGGGIDLKKWVGDTDGFSITHLKELFISVIFFGYDYTKTLALLKRMDELAIEERGESKKLEDLYR